MGDQCADDSDCLACLMCGAAIPGEPCTWCPDCLDQECDCEFSFEYTGYTDGAAYICPSCGERHVCKVDDGCGPDAGACFLLEAEL